MYRDSLQDIVERKLLDLSKTEGTIYRKKWYTRSSNSSISVDKLENGNLESIQVPFEDKLGLSGEDDIIFQYDKKGDIELREDLKSNVIKFASEKLINIKQIEKEKAKEYKQEGHIYIGCEDDGYIFLNDITGEKGYSIEDIDFVVDNYEGDVIYQVINGKYEKIGDLPGEDG